MRNEDNTSAKNNQVHYRINSIDTHGAVLSSSNDIRYKQGKEGFERVQRRGIINIGKLNFRNLSRTIAIIVIAILLICKTSNVYASSADLTGEIEELIGGSAGGALALSHPYIALACVALLGGVVVYDNREVIGQEICNGVDALAEATSIPRKALELWWYDATRGIIDTSSPVFDCMRDVIKMKVWKYTGNGGVAEGYCRVAQTMTYYNAGKAVGYTGTVRDTWIYSSTDTLYQVITNDGSHVYVMYATEGTMQKGDSLDTVQTDGALSYIMFFFDIAECTYVGKYLDEFTISERNQRILEIMRYGETSDNMPICPEDAIEAPLTVINPENENWKIQDWTKGDIIDLTDNPDMDSDQDISKVVEGIYDGTLDTDDAMGLAGVTGVSIPDGLVIDKDTVTTQAYEQEKEEEAGVDTELGNSNEYKLHGLAGVFPFCIPFDIYDMLSLLVGSPEPLAFDFKMPLPDGTDYVINIDLKMFNGVAKIVREGEILLFMIGLAVVSKKHIHGSEG